MTAKNASSSSKSKLKIIIPVAVVLTVAAMFLLFFFARSLFVIDLADYVTVELNPDNDGYVYDGNINCNVKINFLQYVRDSNLIVVKKNVYGDALVFLKPFEAELNGIKIVNDSESSTTCQMYDGNTYLGDIGLSANGVTLILVPNNSEVTLETFITTPQIYTEDKPYTFTVRVD